jgi:hypothetical protein
MDRTGASSTIPPSKEVHTGNKDPAIIVTISEKVNLTEEQNEVLQMVCTHIASRYGQ